MPKIRTARRRGVVHAALFVASVVNHGWFLTTMALSLVAAIVVLGMILATK